MHRRRNGPSWSVPVPVLLVIGWFGYAWTVFLVAIVVVAAVYAIHGLTPVTGPLSIPIALLAVLGLLFAVASLQIRVEPGDGVRVDRRVGPVLHEIIEELSGRLKAPPIRDVLLGSGMEIRTIRVPRLAGLLGFDDYLLIGMPLLIAVPVEQLRALIAHELAHRSRSRSVRGARLYRLRDGWLQLLRSLESSRHVTRFVLRPFFRYFAPAFANLSSTAIQDHEIAADRRAAMITKREHLAGALLRVGVIQRVLVERFHPRLLADLRRCGVAPAGLHNRLERMLSTLRTDPRFASWLDAALHADPAPGDTHAPLSKRLSGLAFGDLTSGPGETLVESAFAENHARLSAMRLCLAALPEAIIVSAEKAWVDELQDSLNDRHEELLRMDERRRELEARTTLSDTERLEQAIATAETEGVDAALPVLRELTADRPEMAPARFVLGTLLLQQSDDEGLAHIHAAVRIDPGLEEPGRELAAAYLRANGMPEELDESAAVGEDEPSPSPERPPHTTADRVAART